MGLLKAGAPMTWEDTVERSEYVRRHGVLQFLAAYRRAEAIADDPLYYGDEVEHALLKLDPSRREVRISLRGAEVMQALQAREGQAGEEEEGSLGATWHQEYGSWMLESTPSAPYAGYAGSLVLVERSMRRRRARLQAALAEHEIAPTMVNFPLMGVGEFTVPAAAPGGPASMSSSVPDACINGHPRFGTLTANIRRRRGSRVDVRVPLFRDEATPEFAAGAAGEPSIEMDCMAYGMGMCCLQVTFQGANMDEARLLHDQLAVLAPILLALTAATPIFRGRLAATDARWSAISASVDDRTPAERGDVDPAVEPAVDARMAGGGISRLSKSRYDSISAYIHPASAAHNDVACEVDGAALAQLREGGVDASLARHIAHLFVRDPLVVFEGAVEEVDDERSTEHFESINSTNWQTMRFKPPPVPRSGAPHVGWRTEFRSMEVQLTDFENAAFVAFVMLVSRAILALDLDLLVPLSKVDENMRRAHAADAVGGQEFWFRTDPYGEAGAREMSMDEIMNGREGGFVGLLPLCRQYLKLIGCGPETLPRLRQYLGLLEGRAAGRLLTPAAWMRRFVREHPEYRRDSALPPGVAYDLVRACDEIGLGRRACPELLGEVAVEPFAGDGDCAASPGEAAGRVPARNGSSTAARAEGRPPPDALAGPCKVHGRRGLAAVPRTASAH